MSNTIDMEFGDGEYTFGLPLPQINELQNKCGPGPQGFIGAIFARVLTGAVSVTDELTGETKVYLDPARAQFSIADIVETIRQGLIGGGKGVVNGEEIEVTPAIANRLINAYVLDRPLKGSWEVAVGILGACIHGFDPPKNLEPAVERAPETAASPTVN